MIVSIVRNHSVAKKPYNAMVLAGHFKVWKGVVMLDALLIRFIPIAEKIIPRRSTIKVLESICIAYGGRIMATDLEMTVYDAN